MKGPVRAKKHLGQHFLRNESIALRIVEALSELDVHNLIEVGPGDGVLTQHIFERYPKAQLFEVDDESIAHLADRFPVRTDQILHQDFLKAELPERLTVIGNFPYNISSQIVFRILEDRQKVEGMVGMFQKEVAERIAAPPGNRTYGILSVLTQAYYEVEYLFTVGEHEFDPPPKVKSGVLRMKRKENLHLDCDEALFFSLVKRSFNQRRKMIRKSLKDLVTPVEDPALDRFLTLRPEALGFEDFIELTRILSQVK